MSGESHTEGYVFIGIMSILSIYILIGAYIHAKRVARSWPSANIYMKVWLFCWLLRRLVSYYPEYSMIVKITKTWTSIRSPLTYLQTLSSTTYFLRSLWLLDLIWERSSSSRICHTSAFSASLALSSTSQWSQHYSTWWIPSKAKTKISITSIICLTQLGHHNDYVLICYSYRHWYYRASNFDQPEKVPNTFLCRFWRGRVKWCYCPPANECRPKHEKQQRE